MQESTGQHTHILHQERATKGNGAHRHRVPEPLTV